RRVLRDPLDQRIRRTVLDEFRIELGVGVLVELVEVVVVQEALLEHAAATRSSAFVAGRSSTGWLTMAVVLSAGASLLSVGASLLFAGGTSCGHVRVRIFAVGGGPGGVSISGGSVGASLIGLSPWDGAASHSGQCHIEVPGQHGELLLIRVVPEVVVVPRPVHGVGVGQQLLCGEVFGERFDIDMV